MRVTKLLTATIAVVAVAGVSSRAWSAPVAGQFVPVGVYLNTQSVFGLAYDTVNDIIHYSEGDSGDNIVHTVQAFRDYTAAEIAALPLVNGIPALSLAAAQNDVAGTTDPGGSGGSGAGAHFSALGFDSSTGQLVQTGPSGVRAYDPFTAANQSVVPNVGSGFADGLDFDGTNRWFSPDVGDIFNNNVLFADNSNNAQTLLPGWTGLGSDNSLGWSGVEQVGTSLFAVAVQSSADQGESRTIVRFDVNTGELLGYDPDGDPVAARWEDLAYDGQFLYAADLRGDADGNGVHGDIYVFSVTGGLNPEPVPEPSTLSLLLAGVFLLVLGATVRRQKLLG